MGSQREPAHRARLTELTAAPGLSRLRVGPPAARAIMCVIT